MAKLKTFRVRVTTDATMSADLKIKAATRDEAAEIALDKARMNDCNWKLNEGNPVDHYLGNEESDIEEI